MASLTERLQKNSTIEETDLVSKSKFFHEKDMVTTPVPLLNIAFSGSMTGGFTSGLTQFAGESKRFKSLFSMIMVKSYLDKYKDAVCLFYDSEFGAPRTYFESLEIDMNRVVHTPITDIEKLKFDIMQQLKEITRKDRVIIFVDSIGNLASKKEVDDANDQKSTADLSRAKALRSLFSMVTPHLTLLDIPMVVVNHTYSETGMFPKTIVRGGQGMYLSSDNIYIISRSQEKDGMEVYGFKFTIKIEKSRHARETSKLPIVVTHEGGLQKWSGMLDLAVEGKFVVKSGPGWYQVVDQETGEIIPQKYRAKTIDNDDFWNPIVSTEKFQKYIKDNFQVSHHKLIHNGEEIEVIGEAEDE